MRHTDYAPLYRTTIGFDHLTRLLDQVAGFDADNGYPPYNIERLAENQYRITMAVAGFTGDELKVEAKESMLLVKGDKKSETADKSFLHRGIAARSFERRFQLADHIEVDSAALKDGLLSIGLTRNVPERLKPRTIAIAAAELPKQIDSKAV
ncbi:MAG: Hsp20 family protein [Hyphomicrobium sp.]